jgi:hypothetical protein
MFQLWREYIVVPRRASLMIARDDVDLDAPA